LYLNAEKALEDKKKKGPERDLTFEHALKR
jgi:hypothetical protein